MKKSDALLIVLFVLCAGIVVVFGIPNIIPYSDQTMGELVADTVPRLAVLIFLIALMATRGYEGSFRAEWHGKGLLWSIPCFLVAIVNFPFTALVGGAATIERLDLLWLFLLKCAAIALLEETFFRGFLLPFFMERLEKNNYGVLISVVSSSALFGLMHLLNLFYGAGFGEVALQVCYTFLIGCMLAVMLLKTKNLWLCVLVHAIFDVGGTIVTDLGSGAFQDTTFWILTAAAGILCTVHIIITLKKKVT